jgi:TRAP-type C4-dicarboxylate transport system substrate-binding protein
MYPAMQLGGEKEMIEQAQVGALAIARVSVGPMGTLVPELNVFNLPFMFADDPHLERVIDGPIGDELLQKLSEHPTAGLIGLCWMNAGSRNIYNSKRPVRSIDDLKGLKIRMMGNPIFVDTMNALGGNGVSMGFDQLVKRDADRCGGRRREQRADLHDRPALPLREIFSLTGHLSIPEIVVFSKKTWEQLSNDDRALIMKLGREAQQEERKLWYEMEAKAVEQLRAAGVDIIKIEDRKPFEAAVMPVKEKYGKQYAELIKRIEALR